MSHKRIFCWMAACGVLVLAPRQGLTAAENIDPANDGSQYAWAENVGWLNAEPSGDGGPGVQVKDFYLTGWMWGENIGWISLSCKNTDTCKTNPYGVANTCAGAPSGYAWAENIGWINFDPISSGVTVSPVTGEFQGYAWGENIGWVSFNCANTASCATASYLTKTSWTPSTTAPASIPSTLGAPGGTNKLLCWDDVADGYDIIRGDLEVLLSTGGDFTVATEECVGDNQAMTFIPLDDRPPAGEGFWYLVRSANCGGAGSYNSGSPSQMGDRDSEINASSNSCP